MIITTDREDYPIVDLQEVASQHDEATTAARNQLLFRLWLKTSTGRKLGKALDTIPLLCAEIGRLRDRWRVPSPIFTT